MWIHLKTKEPLVFAALWDSWHHPQLGDALNTFAIITTEPNSLVQRIHNRMPAICDESVGRQWLEQDNGPAILRPWPAELMAAHDVSNLVNAPENDSPECIKSLPPGSIQSGQLQLF